MIKTFYQNRLPHICPVGATFFVTCRLADALPRSLIKKLQEELNKAISIIKKTHPEDTYKIYEARKRYFGKFDHQLDDKPYGNCYLKQAEIANIVVDKLKAMDGEYYELQAYCIMPNHIHFLIDTSLQLSQSKIIIDENNLDDLYVQLDTIMRLFKGSTARYANLALNRTGTFWFKDSYDHYVRDDREWMNIVNYILDNPVKAGLAKNWEEWNFSYFKYAT